MLLTNSATSSESQTTYSWWTRMYNCFYDKKTAQCAKAFFYYMGAMASPFIPVPFLNGALMGSLVFLGSHEMAKHPDSACMRAPYPKPTSRTWKHLTTGVVIAGMGCGSGVLLIRSFGLVLIVGGLAASFMFAYSDTICMGNYNRPIARILPETTA